MDRLIGLAGEFGLDFNYDDKYMYFGLGNGSRVDKMLDRINTVVEEPLSYSILNNKVKIERGKEIENIIYMLISNREDVYGLYKGSGKLYRQASR